MFKTACGALLVVLTAGSTAVAQSRAIEQRLTVDGAEIAMTLTLPAAPPNPAVVIVCPGAGPASPHIRQKIAKPLLDAGFAVLAYTNPGFEPSGGRQVADLEQLAHIPAAALAWVRSADLPVDRENVGLFGISNGGWVAEIAAAREARFRFVAVQSGPAVSPLRQMLYFTKNRDRSEGRATDVASLAASLREQVWTYLATGRGRRAAQRALDRLRTDSRLAFMQDERPQLPPTLAGDEIAKPQYDFYRHATFDPLPLFERIKQPVFVAYGENDAFVDTAESSGLLARLKKRVPSMDLTVRVYPEAGHGLEKRAAGGPMHDPQSPTVEGYAADLTGWMKSRLRAR